MTVRGAGVRAWLTLLGTIVGLVVSLAVLWSMLAKPAVSEAARAEVKVVTDGITKQIDEERSERKAADLRNDAEHSQMQTRVDNRLSQLERGQADQTKYLLELLRRTPK